AVYKFDMAWHRWKIPLVPYVRAGFDYYVWRIDAGGKEARQPGTTYKFSLAANGFGQGGTFGWHVNPGLAVALDWIEADTARRAYSLAGMKGSYITFEWVFNRIDDFGSARSWDLSFSTFLAGLALEL